MKIFYTIMYMQLILIKTDTRMVFIRQPTYCYLTQTTSLALYLTKIDFEFCSTL